jgi:hypothetical protein
MKGIVRFVMVALAVAGAYWLGLNHGASPGEEDAPETAAVSDAGPTALRTPTVEGFRAGPATTPVGSRTASDRPAFQPAPDDPDAEPRPGSGRAWMREHGFPLDDLEVQRYSSMSDAELARRAGEDKLAAYEQCYRQLFRDNMGEVALDCFVELAARGSHYAMQALAQTYLGMGAEGVVVDPLLAQAWYRASYRLGDWTALMVAHRLNANDPMQPNELLLADALAAQIVDDLDRRHRARTGEPLPVVPAPGYEHTIEHYLEHGLDEPRDPPSDP